MPLDPLDPNHLALSPEQRRADQMASVARQVGQLQRSSLLSPAVARGAGAFSSDAQGQLLVFGASVFNSAVVGSGWGVGVDVVSRLGVGIVRVHLSDTFPTDTLSGVTLPRYGVGALPIGTTAATIRVSACDATTITFQALNSAGTLVDSDFFFIGAGTLAA